MHKGGVKILIYSENNDYGDKLMKSLLDKGYDRTKFVDNRESLVAMIGEDAPHTLVFDITSDSEDVKSISEFIKIEITVPVLYIVSGMDQVEIKPNESTKSVLVDTGIEEIDLNIEILYYKQRTVR
ncbi:MAG: hypothetical protein MI922_08600, partial [Bacteroidales bacterium]|nr:hypothetical protein [Bacteroidales bacterium]